MDDAGAPGPCPSCGKHGFTINRCPTCPLDDLDHVRSTSAAGQLLERVFHLEFVTTNFSMDWGLVSAEEVQGLRALKEERDRWQAEQQDNHGANTG